MRKIFLGLIEVAGYNTRLKRGFEELGLDTFMVSLNKHPFQYDNEATEHTIVKLLYWLRDRKDTRFLPLRVFYSLLVQVTLILVYLKALVSCDVFIFGFASSFFKGYIDLPVLKLFRKTIIYVFLGSDSRPSYISGRSLKESALRNIRSSRRLKANITKIERYADVIINHPPSAHFHERRFVSFMRVGFPFSCDVVPPHCVPGNGRGVRILHAPSHLEGKGTDAIRATVARLREKGHVFEYVELVDKPNALVLEELSRCDFIVDELYSDALMAGFATEAAFFGKPAVVGGYATERDFGRLSPDSVPPVHHCHPDDIEGAIETLIVDGAYRRDLGARAQQFVQRYWSSRSVAERYLRLIEGDFPHDWLHDPRDISYLHGWGVREGQAQVLVRAVIETGGLDALQLGDKPELAQRFHRFAYPEPLQ